MPTPPPKPRYTIEKSDNLVRVILPSQKNILHMVWFFLWFALWGYMVYGFMLITVAFNKAIEIGENSTPSAQPEGFFIYLSIAFLLFFFGLLALGAFAIQRFIWVVAGKEVIEATPQTLTITKQAIQWKTEKKYSFEKLNGLRLNTRPLLTFSPRKRFERFLRGAGMIVFDYGGRTSSFGVGISTAEAEEIIYVLHQYLPQEKAG